MSDISGDYDVFYAPKRAPEAPAPLPPLEPLSDAWASVEAEPFEAQPGEPAPVEAAPVEPPVIEQVVADTAPPAPFPVVAAPVMPAPVMPAPMPAPAMAAPVAVAPVAAAPVVEYPQEYVDFATPAPQRLERRGWVASLILFLALSALVLVTMSLANLIRHDFGHVDIVPMNLTAQNVPGTLSATVYRPINATAAAPAPGVLLLHGYQDDKGAVAPLAAELARRGYVVMAVDLYGHGDTTVGMGTSGEAGWSQLTDSGMGAIVAYAALAELDYVDPGLLAVGGQGLGTWAARSVAAYYANIGAGGVALAPRAVVLQGVDSLEADPAAASYQNVLLIAPVFDELGAFEQIPAAMAVTGSFADGTARQVELVNTAHSFLSVDQRTTAATVDWLDQALGHFSGWSPNNQLFLATTLLQAAATVIAIFAMVPLLSLLLNIPIFRSAAGPVDPRPERVKSGWRWWRGGLLALLLGLVSFPFLVQLGYRIIPLPAGVFRLTLGNGLAIWALFLILLLLLAIIIPWRQAAKRGNPMQWQDLGISDRWDGSRFGWGALGRSLFLAALMLGYLYGIVTLLDWWLGLDLRALWPVLRPINYTGRWWQFLTYLPIFLLFFVLLQMKVFGQMGSLAAARPGWRGFMSCWWRAALYLVGGLLILGLLHYIPLFLGMGAGVNLVLPAFGGLFMGLLLFLVPLVLLLSFLATAIYRKTGQVFLSSLICAALTTWLIAGTTAFI